MTNLQNNIIFSKKHKDSPNIKPNVLIIHLYICVLRWREITGSSLRYHKVLQRSGTFTTETVPNESKG
jgi:hypothetical protein